MIKRQLEKIVPSSSLTTHRMFGVHNTKLDEIKRLIRRNVERESDNLYLSCMANHISRVHYDSFSQYKEINIGKDIAIIGTGPTLQWFTLPENTISMGCNSAYKYMDLDYYFVQDFQGEGNAYSIEEIKALKSIKFIGHYIKRIKPVDESMHSARYVANYVGGKDYYVYDYYGSYIDFPIAQDILDFPLVDNGSTIFAVMQFALYTHPKRIYIVGCDCSYAKGQHFDGNVSVPMQIDIVYENWKKIRDYIKVFYPDIEVISVNPVGLKGFFTDYYTDEYMRSEVMNEH